MRPSAAILVILAAGCAPSKPAPAPLPITGIWLPTNARFQRGIYPDPAYPATCFVEFLPDGTYLEVTHLEGAPGSSPDQDFYEIIRGTWTRQDATLTVRHSTQTMAKGNKGVYTNTTKSVRMTLEYTITELSPNHLKAASNRPQPLDYVRGSYPAKTNSAVWMKSETPTEGSTFAPTENP